MKKSLALAAVFIASAMIPSAAGQSPANAAKPVYWKLPADELLKLVAAKDQDAIVENGNRYYNGYSGFPQDDAKALILFLSVESGKDPMVLYALGCMYRYGYCVTKDEAKVKTYFSDAMPNLTKLAESGYAPAQSKLGYCFESGCDVTADKAAAAKWYARAAEQGYSPAQCNLAFCCFYGVGMPKDEKAAVEWYKKAAEQDNPRALASLGECYENGKGAEKNIETAISCYRKAAEKGDADAKANLERLTKPKQ